MKSNLSIVASQVPWWGKIAAKMILARLPVDYKAWKRLHLFASWHNPAITFFWEQRESATAARLAEKAFENPAISHQPLISSLDRTPVWAIFCHKNQ